MVIDYSERRQVRKPAPKRPPVWPYVMLILVLMLLSFLAGAATGRHLYRPGGRFYKAPPPVAPPASQKQSGALPPQGEPIAPAQPQATPAAPAAGQSARPGQPAPEKGSEAPPLTFYNTLQKGNKGLIGTGINNPKEGQPAAPAKPVPPQTPER